MLNCKQIAQQASDYLDQESSTGLTWQIRLHLLMCANCRRFVRHLRIAKTVTGNIQPDSVDAEAVWAKLKAKQQAEKDNLN